MRVVVFVLFFGRAIVVALSEALLLPRWRDLDSSWLCCELDRWCCIIHLLIGWLWLVLGPMEIIGFDTLLIGRRTFQFSMPVDVNHIGGQPLSDWSTFLRESREAMVLLFKVIMWLFLRSRLGCYEGLLALQAMVDLSIPLQKLSLIGILQSAEWLCRGRLQPEVGLVEILAWSLRRWLVGRHEVINAL